MDDRSRFRSQRNFDSDFGIPFVEATAQTRNMSDAVRLSARTFFCGAMSLPFKLRNLNRLTEPRRYHLNNGPENMLQSFGRLILHSVHRLSQGYSQNFIAGLNERHYLSRQIEPGSPKALRLNLRGRIGLAADAPSIFCGLRIFPITFQSVT